MGGRIASHIASQGCPGLAGLFFLGYPLHPPGAPGKRRDAHLPQIQEPMLFVQGARDAFGTADEIAALLPTLQRATLHVVPDGDHSFKVRASTGLKPDQVLDGIMDVVVSWMKYRPSHRDADARPCAGSRAGRPARGPASSSGSTATPRPPKSRWSGSRRFPARTPWTLLSVQALHRFYRGRSDEVVASWMTRQDRDAAIADNVQYVDVSIAAVRSTRRGGNDERVVFAGFSQGVPMAFRAALLGRFPCAGVLAVGGEIPPELDRRGLLRFPPVLIVRGTRDECYTQAGFDADIRGLDSAGRRACGRCWSTAVTSGETLPGGCRRVPGGASVL